MKPPVIDPVSRCRLVGPAESGNLAVFLFVEEEKAAPSEEGPPLLGIEIAMDRALVVVRETSDVNLLEIENVSEEDEVFVQAGDIVKGGKQDRVIACDAVLPPRSGRVNLRAFCVEQGRWAPRGQEASDTFSSSKSFLSSTELKVATAYANDQGAVWDSVGALQQSLETTSAFRQQDLESATSLQLTLENPEVAKMVNQRLAKLSGLLGDAGGPALGAAFAINGQLVSADVYNSSNLFAQYWPRLLRAAATEAVAKLAPENSSQATISPTQETLRAWMGAVRKAHPEERRVTKRVTTLSRQTDTTLLCETYDSARGGAPVHVNCATNTLHKLQRQPGPTDSMQFRMLSEDD